MKSGADNGALKNAVHSANVTHDSRALCRLVRLSGVPVIENLFGANLGMTEQQCTPINTRQNNFADFSHSLR